MDKREQAIKLFSSTRGQFIVSQALYLAIKKLEEVPEPQREASNIADMELLREAFPLFSDQLADMKAEG